jgi:hypothetical protein
MSLVSDIKLIRTDTTLDLSQKAEKGMPLPCYPFLSCISPKPLPIADRMGHCIVLLLLASYALLLSSSAPGFPSSLSFPSPRATYTQHTGRLAFNTRDLKHMTSHVL